MVPLSAASARIVRYRPQAEMAFHRHDENWFCLVLRGSYEERIRSRATAHEAGQMLFYPAGEDHAQRFGTGGAVKLLFRPPRSGLDYLARRHLPLSDAPYAEIPASLPLAARLIRELRCGDGYAPLAVEGLILELTAAFARAGDCGREASVPAWLKRVRERVEEEIEAPVTLAALAEEAGRHPVHLAREFRRYYGRTVGDLLRGKRLAQAARLLTSSGSMPIVQVALSCGYGDQASFCRAFKARYGLTPSAYRACSGQAR